MLQVVQEQQHPLVVQEVEELAPGLWPIVPLQREIEGLGQRGDDLRRGTERRQGHKTHAVREGSVSLADLPLRRGERQARFAHPSGPDDRNQPHFRVGDEAVQIAQFRRAPDEGRGLWR